MDEFDQFVAQSYGRLHLQGDRTLGATPDVRQKEMTVQDRFPPREDKSDVCSCRSVSSDYASDAAEGEDKVEDKLLSMLSLERDLEWDIGESRPRAQSMPSGSPRHRPRLAQLARGRQPSQVHKVRVYHLEEKTGTLVKAGNRYLCSSESAILKVLLLGALGVGKRALIREFIDPTSSNHIFNSLDDDTDRCVSILLDGEESTMDFVDLSDREVDEYISAEHIDAYVVVYSVEDRDSFQSAIDRLYETRQQVGRHVALILVANKTDLVRTRIIHSDEGKTAAKTYDCKYIEVSAAIDHKVDELLVGILKQIRLIQSKLKKRRFRPNMRLEMDESCCLHKAKQNILARIFKGEAATTRSCDNLYVL